MCGMGWDTGSQAGAGGRRREGAVQGTGRAGPGCSNGLGKHGAPDSGCFLRGVKVVEPWAVTEREEGTLTTRSSHKASASRAG